MKWLIFFAAVGGAVWYLTRDPGFTAAEIDRVKASIKTEFEKRDGVSVEDVTMLKETARKLSGFVKLRISPLPNPITKACNATMEESGGKYLWRCE